MELTYELVKHPIQNRKRRQINALVITYSGSDSSRERKFQERCSREQMFFGTREQMFQGAKVPESESSWNFRSREQKFHTMVLSLPGAKVLRSESSCYRQTDWCLPGVWLNTSPASPASSAPSSTSPTVNYITMARHLSLLSEWDQWSAEGHVD